MASIARIQRRRAKKGKAPLSEINMKLVKQDGILKGSRKRRAVK